MPRNVRTRSFTVNGRKNRAQFRKMQVIATNPYCSMLLLNVLQRRLCDTHKRLDRPFGGGKPFKVQAWALPKSYYSILEFSPVILQEVRRGDKNNPFDTIRRGSTCNEQCSMSHVRPVV